MHSYTCRAYSHGNEIVHEIDAEECRKHLFLVV